MKHLVILAYGTTALYDQLVNNRFVYYNRTKEPLKDTAPSKHWFGDYITPFIDKANEAGKMLIMHISLTHLSRHGPVCDLVGKFKDDFNIVHLVRRNTIATEFSCAGKREMMYRRNVLFAKDRFYQTIDRKEKTVLTLPEKDYFHLCEKRDRIHEHISNSLSCYEITYEDDINKYGPEHVAKGISKHFDFYDDYVYEQMYNNYNSKKNIWSDIKLKDKVKNYQMLVDQLTGTKYEWMIHE